MSVETKFRSLNKRAAECQRHIGKLDSVDSTQTREDIANHIRSDLRQLETDIKAIRELAEEEDEESSKVQILHRLTQYETQFRQLQTTSRAGLWRSKKRLDEYTLKMRHELFGGLQKDDKSFTEQFELKQRRNRGHDESLLRASTDVTEALRRTGTLMQQELEKSSYTTTMLADSSRTLGSTHAEYQNFGSLMVISKRLVGQLEAADLWDRLSLLFGLFVFITVVGYIIKKRTYDVGISWISWIAGKGAKATATHIATVTQTTIMATVSSSSSSSISTSSTLSSSSTTTAVASMVEEITSQSIKQAVNVITETLSETTTLLPSDDTSSVIVSSSLLSSLTSSIIPTTTSIVEHIKDEL
ncbi:Sec20-domain-containing protein [Phascolomyces articulosus]|uniref:Sec20-domain-containing protein n=1 Tax=Phascolomyces articulosus TaxID=60185 RepID=A0AAD5KTZ0_9FUNG|nr:Sec20-domain-containing protein [Phascolomyces articulosus]